MHLRGHVLQAALCFLCACLATMSIDLEGTELGGGTVTGPLIAAQIVGLYLLTAAVALTFLAPRSAAIGALTGEFLCLPLFVYATAPGFYRWLIPDGWSTPLASNFVWDEKAAAGIVVLPIAALVYFRTLLRSGASARRG